MEDIRGYSDNELSMRVFNDEFLYNRSKFPNFMALVDELFIYTNEQLRVLEEDLNEEANQDKTW